MTLDEAIKQCEEAAEERDKLCKRYDDASGYSRSHNEAIRTSDAKKHEKCSQDFRQLAGWLRELRTLMAESEIYDIEYSPWIPISKEMPDENLPEDFQRVQITVVNYAGDKVVRAAIYINLKRRFRVEGSSNFWEIGEEGLLAWKPLPEPYKPESEGER